MKNEVKEALRKEQLRTMEEMANMEVGSDEHFNAAKSLKTIMESETEECQSRISWKVVFESLLQVATGIGILYMATYRVLDDKPERIGRSIVPRLK